MYHDIIRRTCEYFDTLRFLCRFYGPSCAIHDGKPMNKQRFLGPPIAFAMLFTLGVALGNDETQARSLFREGVALMNRGAFAEALDRFDRAYDLWANPKILLNIATTLRQLGRLAEAANAYQDYLNDKQADPSRTAEVKKQVEEIDKNVGVLEIVVAVPGATISVYAKNPQRERGRGKSLLKVVGDQSDTESGWTVRVSPGEHLVSVAKEGYQSVTESVTLAAGERRTLRLTLEIIGEKVSSPKEPPKPLPEKTEAISAETEVDELGHQGQWSLYLRSDMDVSFHGGVGSAGVGYGLGKVAEVQLGALVGRDKGVEPGASLYFAQGTVKPIIFIGLPVFFWKGRFRGFAGRRGSRSMPPAQ